MIPKRFEYFCPTSLQEAISLLGTYGEEAKLLAGGQSLLSLLKLRVADPKYLIDLGRIAELAYIREPGACDAAARTDGPEGEIAIGALTTYAAIKGSRLLQGRCPLLPQTAAVVGDVQVRNRGTLGGSLAHADPAGDMPAAVLALRAELKAVGPSGERWIRAEEFFLGTFATALRPDEILTEIRVPVLKAEKAVYLKAARRPSDFALVGVAVCLKLGRDQACEEVAIGVTGVTEKPYRATGVEGRLRGRRLEPKAIEDAASAITLGVEVSESIHASQGYRSHLARVYASRALQAAR
ncbi:MAG: xanthine dehydrogenase family protein subunit M [Deltaproteobacteria bacterium]|nr:xanthine dehydrogenase family protein subunit M [Deltaproteobacteria bacterium]MBI3079558.1 xanthine dehydrogenase family protein subunit M [Deltaproteobacteria bacterium]